MVRKSEEKMAQKSKNNITKEILMRRMTWGKNEYLLGFDFCLAYSRTATDMDGTLHSGLFNLQYMQLSCFL